ncbi:rhomboid family intramembrane serine protease [Microbacterium nanhaiense]|uniref:Rhomboid family intramembrane serine protease n=1 Tax=Microbacterium nanhaiense TaxID=1301026 RepID=A0ABQ2N0K3_9MICO|nr:rhomboid family intramembrane serine protease [Microbacterium nanhaiense]GGO62711.1 rhomboid family intramembrane serine protease [Microbacterium nanhaiense]
MTTPTPAPRRPLLEAAMQPLILLAVIWAVQFVNVIVRYRLNYTFGVEAWDPPGLIGLVTSPFLHSGWGHIIANSVPFAILGVLIAFEGTRRYWIVTGITAASSGIFAWVINSPGTVTVGASGVVFGYFGYLMVRAFFAPSVGRGILYGAIALVVGSLYGATMLTGIFAAGANVSWQGHVGGAIGGAIAAHALRPKRRPIVGSA